MMDKLKPCPFCGENEVYADISYAAKEFRIYCNSPMTDCVAEMRLSFADAGLGNGEVIDFEEVLKIIEQMIDLWNTRTPTERGADNG